MTINIDAMKSEAQQTLDQLFAEGKLPFKLPVRVVEAIGTEEYIVRFNDSRLYSIDVSCERGQRFDSVFTAAILERVARLRKFSH